MLILSVFVCWLFQLQSIKFFVFSKELHAPVYYEERVERGSLALVHGYSFRMFSHMLRWLAHFFWSNVEEEVTDPFVKLCCHEAQCDLRAKMHNRCWCIWVPIRINGTLICLQKNSASVHVTHNCELSPVLRCLDTEGSVSVVTQGQEVYYWKDHQVKTK